MRSGSELREIHNVTVEDDNMAQSSGVLSISLTVLRPLMLSESTIDSP